MGGRVKPGWALVVLVLGWWLFGNEEPDQTPTLSGIGETFLLNPPPTAKPSPAINPLPLPKPKVRHNGEVNPRNLYSKTAARVRKYPTTNSPIVATLPKGQQVKVFGRDGEWFRISAIGITGWVRNDLLEPAGRSQNVLPPTASATSPLLVRPAKEPSPGRRRGDRPVRDRYVGTCDCPYDVMRNGRLCGGRSAYSRPGGREPVCYE